MSVVPICTTSLTFSNSTFCPHSVFMWISEQTAIISLYNINWLIFITEAECLLRGTDWLITFCIRIMPCFQTVPRLRQSVAGLSWRSGFDSVRMTLVVDTVSLGRVFLPVLWYYPISVIPPMLHTHLHLRVALTTRTKARSLGTRHQAILFRKSAEHRTEKYFHFFMHKGGRTQNVWMLRTAVRIVATKLSGNSVKMLSNYQYLTPRCML